MKESEEIKRALDLSTWTEYRGNGSTTWPVCPYCNKGFTPGDANHWGIATCPHCKNLCKCVRTITAAGLAWVTWKMEPELPVE